MKRPFFEHPLFNFMFTHETFLEEGDPLKEYMGNVTAMFDYLIDFLRKDFPNPEINQLCTLAWRLIGNKKVQVAMGLPIPTNFGFAVIGNQQNQIPIVAIREDWLAYVTKERTMGLGAIVMASSQCRDWYNGRIIAQDSNDLKAIGPSDPKSTERRAHMYEAEMLLTLMEHDQMSSAKLTEWQEKVLQEFPKGLKSGEDLLYKPLKEFMGVY